MPLQSYGVNLWYFKLKTIDLIKLKVWKVSKVSKVYGVGFQRLGLKNESFWQRLISFNARLKSYLFPIISSLSKELLKKINENFSYLGMHLKYLCKWSKRSKTTLVHSGIIKTWDMVEWWISRRDLICRKSRVYRKKLNYRITIF